MTDEERIELRTPAEVMRDALHDGLTEALAGKVKTWDGGDNDGVQFVTWNDLRFVVLDVFESTPLPDTSDHAAAVITPARIAVDAVCPQCKLPAKATVVFTTVLSVESTSSDVKVKSHTKPVAHVCGQLTLPTEEPVEGQQSFELSDIIGEPDDESRNP